MRKNFFSVALGILTILSVLLNLYQYNFLKATINSIEKLSEEKDNLSVSIDNENKLLAENDEKINALETQMVSVQTEIDKMNETAVLLETETEELRQKMEEMIIEREQGTTDNNGKTNNGEQSSTTGGQGNSQTSGAPGGDANVPNESSGGMSLEDAAAKFGAEFIGSGVDTSGFDHGDGDANWVLE